MPQIWNKADLPQILLNVVISNLATSILNIHMLLPYGGAIWADKPKSTILY